MGGPFWASRDAAAWSIPKGLIEGDEQPLVAALREFEEELGVPAPQTDVPDLNLGTVRQRAGKLVSAWAREAELDVTTISSNTFALEWPPRSGRMQEFPELDRAGWFPLARARGLVVAGQVPLLDRLEERLGVRDGLDAET